MSELLDKQVDTKNENIKTKNCGVHTSPRKVCDENRRKNDCHVNFLLKGGLYKRLYQKTGWSDFDELQVTDSTLNEGTNSLINN